MIPAGLIELVDQGQQCRCVDESSGLACIHELVVCCNRQSRGSVADVIWVISGYDDYIAAIQNYILVKISTLLDLGVFERIDLELPVLASLDADIVFRCERC